MITRSNVLRIDKTEVPNNILAGIKADLCIEFKQYVVENNDSFVDFWEEDDDYLYIPRNYPIENKIKNLNIDIVDDFTDGEDININIHKDFSFRDDIQQKGADFLIKENNGILALVPGKGKTVISIYAITQIKKKTLIVVDQEKLLSQWTERLLEFTDIKEDDIGIIRKDKFEIDKPIVIAMIQTLYRKAKPEDYLKNTTLMKDANFGLTLIDEVHTLIGTKTLTKAMDFAFSRKIFGISATPFRLDDSTKIIPYHLGLNKFENLTYDLKPKIILDTYLPEFNANDYGVSKYLNPSGNFNKMRYYTMLLKHSSNYFIKIKEHFWNFYNEGRNILMLSDMKKNLNLIKEYILDEKEYLEITDTDFLHELHKKYTTTKKVYKQEAAFNKAMKEHPDKFIKLYNKEKDFYIFHYKKNTYYLNSGHVYLVSRKIPENEIGMFVGGSDSSEKDKRIVLSTFKMMAKGIDSPHLDTLMFVSQIGSIITLEQSIGRILRRYPNKKQPLVLDLYEPHTSKMFYYMMLNRKKFYAKKNFTII